LPCSGSDPRRSSRRTSPRAAGGLRSRADSGGSPTRLACSGSRSACGFWSQAIVGGLGRSGAPGCVDTLRRVCGSMAPGRVALSGQAGRVHSLRRSLLLGADVPLVAIVEHLAGRVVRVPRAVRREHRAESERAFRTKLTHVAGATPILSVVYGSGKDGSKRWIGNCGVRIAHVSVEALHSR